MKPMTDSVRQQIIIRKKNNLDISDLVDGIALQGEDLSGAIITKFNRVVDNLSNCNFSRCIIGTEGEITNLSGSNLKNCIFYMTQFKGKVWMRRVDARGANFNRSFLGNLEYQHADFRDATFCETVLRIGSGSGMKAKFSQSFFNALCEGWNIEVKKREE